MQKEIFLKFVAKLEDHCDILLVGSEVDYRRLIAQKSIDQVEMLAKILFWCVKCNLCEAI